jgi:predicted metal-dependent enzyme (double-stranded beta helix superfamily)
MCMGLEGPTADGRDEWFLNSPAMTAFIAEVNTIRAREAHGSAIVREIQPAFERLLADRTWLPEHFQEPSESSGMGGGIGMWLLYRAGDGGLAFSSLGRAGRRPDSRPRPPRLGHRRPLSGRAGRGRLHSPRRRPRTTGRAKLEVAERRSIVPGDCYELLPETDIHRVRTTSNETSVSLHLLGNDNGCIVRHRFSPEDGTVAPFKSGWLNVPAPTKQTPPTSQSHRSVSNPIDLPRTGVGEGPVPSRGLSSKMAEMDDRLRRSLQVGP